MPESLPAASIILLLIRQAGQFQKQNIYCSIYIYYFCLAYSKVWWKIHRQTNILSWIVTKWSLFFQQNLPGGLRTTSIGFCNAWIQLLKTVSSCWSKVISSWYEVIITRTLVYVWTILILFRDFYVMSTNINNDTNVSIGYAKIPDIIISL